MNKEIKFLLIFIFILFAIFLLFCLVNLITFIRFDCNQFINYVDHFKFNGTIDNVLQYLQSGDIILKSNFFRNNLNSKFECYEKSRHNFIPNGKNYTHIFLVIRKNGKLYGAESQSKDKCCKQYSVLNKNYKTGIRVFDLENYFKSFQKNKNNKDCNCFFNIRFVNRKFNQEEITTKIVKEINILNGISFKAPHLIGFIGWTFNDFPADLKYGLDLLLENNESESEKYFCSEFVAAVLQRTGLMKRNITPSFFFPSYFSGFLDNKIFLPNTYSKIYSYKL